MSYSLCLTLAELTVRILKVVCKLFNWQKNYRAREDPRLSFSQCKVSSQFAVIKIRRTITPLSFFYGTILLVVLMFENSMFPLADGS